MVVALLLGLLAPGARSQSTKTCMDDGNGVPEAASTPAYRIRPTRSCATVFGGNPPWCGTADWRDMQLSAVGVPAPTTTEEACHMYHCSDNTQCKMCDGQSIGHVLTEPCSCFDIKAAARSSFPHNCVPNPLAARGDPCVHGYQCATGFCCPVLKVCLTDSLDDGAVPLADTWVRDIVSIGGGTCTTGLESSACKSYESGEPTASFDQTQCGCNSQYMDRFNAETWVQCNTPCTCGGGSPCPATNYASCAAGDSVRAFWAAGSLWFPASISTMDEGASTITVTWDMDSTTSVVAWDKVWKGKHQCATSAPPPTDAPTTATPGTAAPNTTASPPPGDKGTNTSAVANTSTTANTTTAPPAADTTTAPPAGPVVRVAADIVMENLTAFNATALKASLAEKANLDLDAVEIVSVAFKVVVEYTFASTITAAQARLAIAQVHGVPESRVEVAVAAARRLHPQADGRRLASSDVSATITSENAAAATAVQASAGNASAVAAGLALQGVSTTATVKSAPVSKVSVVTAMRPAAGAAPTASAASSWVQEAGSEVGGTVTITDLNGIDPSQVAQNGTASDGSNAGAPQNLTGTVGSAVAPAPLAACLAAVLAAALAR